MITFGTGCQDIVDTDYKQTSYHCIYNPLSNGVISNHVVAEEGLGCMLEKETIPIVLISYKSLII